MSVEGAAPPAGSGAAPAMSVTCQRPAVIRNVIEYPTRCTPASPGCPVDTDLGGDQITVPVTPRIAAHHNDLGAVHDRRGDLPVHPGAGRGRCVPGQDEIQLHRIGNRPRPQERHQHAAGHRLGDRGSVTAGAAGVGAAAAGRDRHHRDITDHPHTSRARGGRGHPDRQSSTDSAAIRRGHHEAELRGRAVRIYPRDRFDGAVPGHRQRRRRRGGSGPPTSRGDTRRSHPGQRGQPVRGGGAVRGVRVRPAQRQIGDTERRRPIRRKVAEVEGTRVVSD